MDAREFKLMFDSVSKNFGFAKNFGGWFKESSECIVVLDLQKSNYSNSYYLNIKVYIQGFFGVTYVMNKFLVKNDVGIVSTRSPKEYRDIFDLENQLENINREEKLHKLFIEFLMPFTNKALVRSGIKKLAEDDEILLQPAVQKELYSTM